MIQKIINKNKRKKERLKINNMNDFKDALRKEGYEINQFDDIKLKEYIKKTFKLDNSMLEMICKCINDENTTYRANDIIGFIDYVEKIMLFRNTHNILCEKISRIKRLDIKRVEYERIPSLQDNVEDTLKIIEELKKHVSGVLTEEEFTKLEYLEKELDEDNIYTKDIELLKKMVIPNKEVITENYNNITQIKTISIKIPTEINYHYIKVKVGSVEYHQYLSSNILRMQRLIKNIDKYLESDNKDKATYSIDQSKVLQDTINIAIALYDNREFKAISGSNNIDGYCMAPPIEKAVFECCKVNKLGELGIGYKRVNDSEKKIFEEIHKQIENKELKDEGTLILYSKWEPCPSCYFVISQFCIKHPNIKIQVKYSEKYGE